MFTVAEMETSNAFIQLMRDKKVTLELDLETSTTDRVELGIVFVFDDPDGPKDYTIVTKYDRSQVIIIKEALENWLLNNTD